MSSSLSMSCTVDGEFAELGGVVANKFVPLLGELCDKKFSALYSLVYKLPRAGWVGIRSCMQVLSARAAMGSFPAGLFPYGKYSGTFAILLNPSPGASQNTPGVHIDGR